MTYRGESKVRNGQFHAKEMFTRREIYEQSRRSLQTFPEQLITTTFIRSPLIVVFNCLLSLEAESFETISTCTSAVAVGVRRMNC